MDQNTYAILQGIGAAMDKGFGGGPFVVLVLKIGEPTLCNYVGNVETATMKAALTDVLARWDDMLHAPGEVQ